MDAAQSSEALYCGQCGRPSMADELARFGNLLVCPACKESYAQKLREGSVQPVGVRYAGFWIRFLGALIDAVILYLVYTVPNAIIRSMFIVPPSQIGTVPDASALARIFGFLGIVFLVQILISACYEGFFIGKIGATPGKLVVGVKVVRPDGSPVSLGRAFGRYFAKWLSALTILIGYIIAGFDSQKRALHDMVCDTRVVKTRV